MSSDAALDLLLQERLVGRDAGLALGLPGARRHPDPLQLALEGPLAGGFRLLLPGEALLLLLEPGRVVPLPGDAVAAVELQDPAGHVVEEVAVVGDRHHRARVLLEEPLQPRHGLGVEVVGRLVEEQHVRPLQEQPAERHAPRLAARERLDVLVAGRHAKRVHRHLDRPVELPAPDGLDGVLEAPLLGEELLHLRVRHGLGEPRADLLEPAEEVAGRGHALLDVAEDRLRRIEPRLLREIPDPHVVGRPRLAEEVLVHAGHDAKQRRLPGAVRAEHADLRAREEGEVDAAKDLPLGRDDLPQVAHGEDVLGRHGAHV